MGTSVPRTRRRRGEGRAGEGMKKRWGQKRGQELGFYLVAAGAGGESRTRERSQTAVKGGEWVAGAPGRRAGWAGHASLTREARLAPTRLLVITLPALKFPGTNGHLAPEPGRFPVIQAHLFKGHRPVRLALAPEDSHFSTTGGVGRQSAKYLQMRGLSSPGAEACLSGTAVSGVSD